MSEAVIGTSRAKAAGWWLFGLALQSGVILTVMMFAARAWVAEVSTEQVKEHEAKPHEETRDLQAEHRVLRTRVDNIEETQRELKGDIKDIRRDQTETLRILRQMSE